MVVAEVAMKVAMGVVEGAMVVMAVTWIREVIRRDVHLPWIPTGVMAKLEAMGLQVTIMTMEAIMDTKVATGTRVDGVGGETGEEVRDRGSMEADDKWTETVFSFACPVLRLMDFVLFVKCLYVKSVKFYAFIRDTLQEDRSTMIVQRQFHNNVPP